MPQLLKLQNGMTPKSLKFVVKCLLDGCIEKIQSNLPPETSRAYRQCLYNNEDFDIRDMIEWENGIVSQTLGAIAIIAAQSIEDGIGDPDVDMMLGNWDDTCAQFIRINWENEDAVRARWEEVVNNGGAHMSKILINFPNTEVIADTFVRNLLRSK